MMFTDNQLLYVAKKANQQGGRGKRLVSIILPISATDGEFDFKFVYDIPEQSASDKDWRDE